MRILSVILLLLVVTQAHASTPSSNEKNLLKMVSDDPEVYDKRGTIDDAAFRVTKDNKICNKNALKNIADPRVFFGGKQISPAKVIFFYNFKDCEGIEGKTDRIASIHYAVPRVVLQRYGYFNDGELYSFYNMRGIPDKSLEKEILKDWDRFFLTHQKSKTKPSVKDVLKFALKMDIKYGSKFLPPIIPSARDNER